MTDSGSIVFLNPHRLPELDSGSQSLHCQPQGDSVSSDLRNDGGCPQGDSVSSDLRNDGGVTYGMTVFRLPELDSGSQALHCQPHGDSVSSDLRNDGGCPKEIPYQETYGMTGARVVAYAMA